MNQHLRHRTIRSIRPTEQPAPLDELRRVLEEGGPWASSALELASVCGGVDALLALDASTATTALEDVPDRRHAQHPVARSLEHALDSIPSALLDDEYREIVWRLFAFAAASTKKPLARRSAPHRLAAALTWVALIGNMEIGRGRGQLSGQLLWYWFGVSSCAGLGRTLATDLGMRIGSERVSSYALPCGDVHLGDVRLLHSSTRAWLTRQRDATAQGLVQIAEQRAERRPMRGRAGGTVELRCAEYGFLGALKLQPERRQKIALLLGDTVGDPDEIVAVSVPDAHRLVLAVQSALGGPPVPSPRPG